MKRLEKLMKWLCLFIAATWTFTGILSLINGNISEGSIRLGLAAIWIMLFAFSMRLEDLS